MLNVRDAVMTMEVEQDRERDVVRRRLAATVSKTI